MKKYIYTIIMGLLTITIAHSQRMLPKQKGLELNFGVLSDGKIKHDYFINIGMTVNGKNGNYQLWALEYTQRYHSYKTITIPQQIYTAEGGYNFFLLGDTHKNVTLNLGITGIIGYESINRGKTTLYDGAKILSEDNFVYGAGGRLSLETYLTDHLVFVMQGRTKVLWGTTMEQFRPSAGLGLRFNF